MKEKLLALTIGAIVLAGCSSQNKNSEITSMVSPSITLYYDLLGVYDNESIKEKKKECVFNNSLSACREVSSELENRQRKIYIDAPNHGWQKNRNILNAYYIKRCELNDFDSCKHALVSNEIYTLEGTRIHEWKTASRKNKGAYHGESIFKKACDNNQAQSCAFISKYIDNEIVENRIEYAQKACDLDNTTCLTLAQFYVNFAEPYKSKDIDLAEHYAIMQYDSCKSNFKKYNEYEDGRGMLHALHMIAGIRGELKQDKAGHDKYLKEATKIDLELSELLRAGKTF